MSVCVGIAAWNAEQTVSRAVTSALAQPEVTEVILVNDASTDRTVAMAAAADDGTGRLQILNQARNAGPSVARNRALATSQADYFAVLDADDYLLPGRFSAMLAIDGWDAIADNIAFIREECDQPGTLPDIADFPGEPRPLSLAAFLDGAISRSGKPRGELGFLKPLFRRQALVDNGLQYHETLRLSEDFVLYARLLGLGGRFLLLPRCGYVAIERAGSLSGVHSTADLGALLDEVDRWAEATALPPEARTVFHRYRAQLSANFRHRRLLDDKRARGLMRALYHLLDEPRSIPAVAARIARDKLHQATGSDHAPTSIRYLLPE